MALRLCDTELVAFLDDDNWWAPDHVESLHAEMLRSQVPAVHCWRRIAAEDGSTWHGDKFPWLDAGSDRERSQFEACTRLGIIEPGSDIVRDTARAELGGEDAGMVDLGGWLLRTDLLRMFGISAVPDACEAPMDGVGEDDILLAQLKSVGIPIACTGAANARIFAWRVSNGRTGRGGSPG